MSRALASAPCRPHVASKGWRWELFLWLGACSLERPAHAQFAITEFMAANTRHAQGRGRRQLRLDRNSQRRHRQREPRRLVPHRHHEPSDQVAVPRHQSPAQRIPRGLRLREGSPPAGRAVAHQFQTERRRRIPRARRAGRHERRVAIRVRSSRRRWPTFPTALVRDTAR